MRVLSGRSSPMGFENLRRGCRPPDASSATMLGAVKGGVKTL